MLTITLVASEGVPPLRFGMSAAEASEAMRVWGPVTANQPDRPSRTTINAHDDAYLWDVHANLEDGEHVTSIVVWRTNPDEPFDPATTAAVRVEFEGIDLFGQEASAVIEELQRRGHTLNNQDPWWPGFDDIALWFNRESGDDRDDEDFALYFASVTIVPPDHPSSEAQ